MPEGPSGGASAWRRAGATITVVATTLVVGLVVQACGVASMGGMDSMGGGMMDRPMAGDDRRYADATAAPPVADVPEVRVLAGDLYFDPGVLRLDVGATVNITLDNQGAAFHDLTIPALDFVLVADAGTEATASLAVAEPGTYTFFCSVPGHAQAGMTGTLAVT